jgi:hypothetical protein
MILLKFVQLYCHLICSAKSVIFRIFVTIETQGNQEIKYDPEPHRNSQL